MYLQHLNILNYKNIREAEIDFSPKLNCFFGRNGQGKTNVLDAIYYLSFCKSHTNPIDSQNIFHDADALMLLGVYEYEEDNDTLVYSCGIKRRQKKVFRRDGKNYERLADHIGNVPLVMVSPADEELIREGSEERRRFMDMAISQYDHPYMTALMQYNYYLQQRNALLKNEDQPAADEVFEIYEMPMGELADSIHARRKAFVDAFVPVFDRYYREISGQREQVGLSYRSHLAEGDLTAQLARTRLRDCAVGHTTRGIHKDDLEITMDGYPIKRVGSQGQNKTCLIAMKLAQYDFLKQSGCHTPILLLDDLFDKLDEERVDRILEIVSSDEFGQIFITDTHFGHLSRTMNRICPDYRTFRIEQGEIATFQPEEELMPGNSENTAG